MYDNWFPQYVYSKAQKVAGIQCLFLSQFKLFIASDKKYSFAF